MLIKEYAVFARSMLKKASEFWGRAKIFFVPGFESCWFSVPRRIAPDNSTVQKKEGQISFKPRHLSSTFYRPHTFHILEKDD
jgi:hypothetical protein